MVSQGSRLQSKRTHEGENGLIQAVSLKDSLIWDSIVNNNEQRRSLFVTEPIIGVKKVLFVRVEIVDGVFKPTQSEEDLFDDIDDGNNVYDLTSARMVRFK